MTKAFTDLGNSFHGAQVWLHAHKDLEKQWANNIMDTVKGIESYFVAHKKDLLAIGKLIGDIAGWIGTLGKALGSLIGPLTTVAGLVAKVADILIGTPVTKQQVQANANLQKELNGGNGLLYRPGALSSNWNTPQSRARQNNAGTLPNGLLHFQQTFVFNAPADKNTVAGAAHAGTTAAIAAAQKKSNHGALFTGPNTANISLFGAHVLGAH